MSRLRCREPKQRHLSGGVKAQPEQETERRHLPAVPKQRKERPKQSRQRAAAAHHPPADLKKILKAHHPPNSQRNDPRRNQHDGGVPERKEKTDREWPFAVLNQFSGYIVDGGDVICINRMAQSQAVRKQRGAQLHRVIWEELERPNARRNVCTHKERI